VHLATSDWQRGKWAGTKGKYSREHFRHLAGGAKLKARLRGLLPKAFADRAGVSSEQMLAAAVASMHVLSR
jgi:hypothetical protein